MVSREVKPSMYALITPVCLLSLGAFSIFTIDINDPSRYGTLFTIILTCVAQSFVADSRLPRLPYFTWVDYALFSMQLFIYGLVLETAVCPSIAKSLGMDANEVDLYASYFFGVLFCFMFLGFFSTAWFLLARRDARIREFIEASETSFDTEEKRAVAVQSGRAVSVVLQKGQHGYKSTVVHEERAEQAAAADRNGQVAVTATVEPRAA